MKTDQAPKPKFRSDYRPPAYLVERVHLDFDLIPNRTIVKARIEFRRNPAGDGGPLVLDGEKLELLSLKIDGKALGAGNYKVEEETLTVLSVPAAFTLESEVAIDPAGNSELEGLYLSGGNFCTQCEPESFRRITYYPDRPDVLARYSVRMAADKAAYPVLLSNGNPGKSGDLPGGRHFAEWDDPWPKPCYLFALVAGNLGKLSDSFTTRSGRKVELSIYAAHADLDKLGHAMDSLKKSMRWDEENYNAEYDLDVFNIVAVSDFNAGAMENKGLNIFNTKYVLAKAETATDTDYDQIEAVIAHEYFHNWSGDRVTCRDWFQLSLKEGFTVFRDQQFSSDMGSAATVRIDRVKDLRRRQFPEDAGPTAHPVRPDSYIEMNNFFTPTVYEKGSEVIRMLQNLAGPAAFRKGAELYFKRHDGQAVTCDDFVSAMAEASGLDLSQFKLWYSQAGTPELEVSSQWDQVAGKLTLKVKQSLPATPGQSEKQPMHIPLAIGLVGPDGFDLPPTLEGEALSNQGTTRTLHLREEEETFTFVGLKTKPVLSLLRGFSAPVKLKGERSADELAFLMAKDQDAFARWEAGQQLAVKVLLALVADYRAGRALKLDATFQGAMAALLDDRLADPALIAYAASLPSREYIADQMAAVDVEGIDAAYDFLRRSLAQNLHDRWQELYRRHKDDGAYRYEPDAVGKRQLRNLALSYLSAEGGAKAEALVLSHLDAASNMTDRLAALRLLDDLEEPPRAKALAAFAKDWRGEALVMDKWFAIQAVYRLPDILARIEALLADPSFDLKNPNKVYALIASFGAGNFAGFHQASGAGYRFLADQILKIDRLNPQVAARLMVPLGRWRRQDGERQKKMCAELQRILAAPGLSKGVFEIASKALAA